MEYLKSLIIRFLLETNFLQAKNLCQDIINAESSPDKNLQKRLDWVNEHTTDRLNVPFDVVETFISKNANRSLQYDVELPIMNTWPRRYKEYQLMDLVIEMKKAYSELRKIVTTVAKKYDLSLPTDSTASVSIPEIKAE